VVDGQCPTDVPLPVTTVPATSRSDWPIVQLSTTCQRWPAGRAVQVMSLVGTGVSFVTVQSSGYMAFACVRLTDHSNAVSSVDFSPDGTVLATASEDHTVHLLDVRVPDHPVQLAELTGPAAAISLVTFSPDGRMLATSADDATARVWDVSDRTRPQELAVLTGHAGPVSSVAFSPDDRQIATTGDDHTVRLWTVGADDVAARICALSGPPLSAAQWARYVPDLPYRPLCPA
jgi:WD40 repeat protein